MNGSYCRPINRLNVYSGDFATITSPQCEVSAYRDRDDSGLLASIGTHGQP
jgi:hypothetical protein